jgi:maltokinase
MDVERIRVAVERDSGSEFVPDMSGSGEVTHVLDALTLPGGAALAVIERAGELFTAPVVDDGVIRRARPGDGAFAGVLRVLADDRNDDAFEVRRVGDVPPPGDEAALDVASGKASVVVGDAAVVKLFPRTAAGPQPGLDVPEHLAAVGFTETPRPIGAVLWHDAQNRPVLLATAAAYLPGASDGWDWYPELVVAMLDGDASTGAAVEPSERMGELVARLHGALATPSAVFPDPVGMAGPAELRGWRERVTATLEEALQVTAGVEGARLRALAPAIREAFETFDRVETTPMMRVHGDLHVGQVFRWAGEFAIGDFDGNPLAPVDERVAPASAARDVASMVRAIDHVARIAIRRRPGTDAAAVAWLTEARGRFLAAYRSGLGKPGDLGHGRLVHFRDVFDERLLRPFEVAQECHEFVYAARFLPSWVVIPDRSIAALLSPSS